jgi:hypothetical protein
MCPAAVRWAACEVEVMDAASADDAIQATRGTLESAVVRADGRLVAARVTLRTAADVHRALLADTERWTQRLRAVALDAGGDNLWIERVQFVPGAAARARSVGHRWGCGRSVRHCAARATRRRHRDDDADE